MTASTIQRADELDPTSQEVIGSTCTGGGRRSAGAGRPASKLPWPVVAPRPPLGWKWRGGELFLELQRFFDDRGAGKNAVQRYEMARRCTKVHLLIAACDDPGSQEIADYLGVSPSTVKRARRQLAEYFAAEGPLWE